MPQLKERALGDKTYCRPQCSGIDAGFPTMHVQCATAQSAGFFRSSNSEVIVMITEMGRVSVETKGIPQPLKTEVVSGQQFPNKRN